MGVHTATVEVPVLMNTFIPVLLSFLKIAPCLKPSYPSGTVFPSASRIRSVVLYSLVLPVELYGTLVPEVA